MRFSKIRNVIIDAGSSLSFLFFFIIQPGYITIIIITPHNRYIFRYFKTVIIYIEHLLIGHESLRNPGNIGFQRLSKQSSLVSYHLRQYLCLFVQAPGTLHFTIMNSTHPDSIYIFRMLQLIQTFHPKGLYFFLVSHIIICFSPGFIPFTICVSHQWLTMGSSHYDTIFISHLSGTVDKVKRSGTTMHCRP